MPSQRLRVLKGSRCSLPVVQDGDTVEVQLAMPGEAPVLHQFFWDVGRGAVMVRDRRYFAKAARDRRLIVVKVRRTGQVVALLSFAENERAEELTGLLCHPEACGFGIAMWAAWAAMVYRLGSDRYDSSPVERIAHVAVGNNNPRKLLQRLGFCREGRPRAFPLAEFPKGAMDHLVQPGEDVVYGYRYRFDPAVLDRLIYGLWRFIAQGGTTTSRDNGATIRFVFDPDLIDFEYLNAHVAILEAEGRLNDPASVAD